MSEDKPTVLVVDDDRRLAELYGLWLGNDYEVETAHGGAEALEKIYDDVDLVLLDRRMPGKRGEDVLEQIRSSGYDAHVVMVTAVVPDLDVIEMGFDDYVVKPLSKEDLREKVEEVLDRRGYGDDVRKYFELSSKAAVLKSEKSRKELRRSEEFQELERRLEEAREEAEESLERIEDFDGAYREV